MHLEFPIKPLTTPWMSFEGTLTGEGDSRRQISHPFFSPSFSLKEKNPSWFTNRQEHTNWHYKSPSIIARFVREHHDDILPNPFMLLLRHHDQILIDRLPFSTLHTAAAHDKLIIVPRPQDQSASSLGSSSCYYCSHSTSSIPYVLYSCSRCCTPVLLPSSISVTVCDLFSQTESSAGVGCYFIISSSLCMQIKYLFESTVYERPLLHSTLSSCIYNYNPVA